MNKLKLLATIYLKHTQFYFDKNCQVPFKNPDELSIGRYYSNNYADALLIFDLSTNELERQEALLSLKILVKDCEIPVYVSGKLKDFEDVKKYLYTGAEKVVFYFEKVTELNIIEEAVLRFGKERFLLATLDREECKQLNLRSDIAGIDILFITKEIELTNFISIFDYNFNSNLHGVAIEMEEILDFLKLKNEIKNNNYEIDVFKSPISWSDMKLNSDGLIPVIVQENKTNEVLMLAYMNEEAFNITLKTGKMTFYSRSRQAIWTKGLTSGHFQYLKSLTLDCDNDTILSKVSQVGVACHTGEVSCFFKEIVKKDSKETDPLKVFEDVYNIIKERKNNAKDGSYTTYLFDKGIDKILKKIGEEATEIIIAAKNPNSEEIIYEISDFLYHVMVLMVEKEVSWEDIIRELANRQ
ncbi:MAG: bifunctional phosphoribosyl-AMP cyclohydrolase/phosphoribosyl-ATP diphosphatase HisIE [Clostridiales bacterium]|nr:bifunctional phosphoribosyl-AMP cyclohydrolase/phosphoribosyl-ATP diphosphatase HisIE [Clostridiales bacterium]